MDFANTENLSRWAGWVRGSLYLTEYAKGLGWDANAAAETVKIRMDGAAMVTLARPSDSILAKQAAIVRDYADLRADRTAEITSQLGFPTEYFAMILGLHGAQHEKTLELLAATQVVAAHTAMIAKFALAVRRPDQVDGRILPMIATPGHGSFPSAHATEAYAAMTVLSHLVTQWGSMTDQATRLAMLRGLAERIAVNRTVAGVHFPVDSWAGAALGTAIGRAVLRRCGQQVDTPSMSYAAIHSDFTDHALQTDAAANGLTQGSDYAVSESPIFSWLWDEAMKERQGPSAGV